MEQRNLRVNLKMARKLDNGPTGIRVAILNQGTDLRG